MVTLTKKIYMRKYNQLPSVKSQKREYMRKIRAEKEQEASRNLVRLLLDSGFEDQAYEVALERAPEMLATIKVRRK